jgi:class 3 adenylate cyclase
MSSSPVRYVKSGDEHIAYRTIGTGALDVLLILPSFIGTVEMVDEPPAKRMTDIFGGFARLISFDRRGTGCSDPTPGPPTLEEQMADILAVLEAASASRVVISAEGESGALAVMFAATHPERVSHLALMHPMARLTYAPGYEFAQTTEQREKTLVEPMYARWGSGENGRVLAPVMAERDPSFLEWWGRWERISASPGSMLERVRFIGEVDVREILPQVQAPTLIMNRPDAQAMNSAHAEYFAEHIPGARLIDLPGRDSISFGEGLDEAMRAIEEFATGTTAARRDRRALATVLFTDIVGSTKHASELGDTRWREKLEEHDRITRGAVAAHGGTAIKSTGDGFLATFDGPARAVRCATELGEEVSRVGIELRAGLHAGEVELMGDDVGGMAVHIGARIGALGGPGDVLVSSTVRDLVVGSGIDFADRGEHDLKGVPGSWRVFAAVGEE